MTPVKGDSEDTGRAGVVDWDPRSAWDYLTLLLWTLFFAIGMAPEFVFYGLRDLAGVSTFTAIVNTSAVITLSWAAFLAYFVYQNCRESGLDTDGARGKALQLGVLSLLAFLELPARGATFEARTLIEVFYYYEDLPTGSLRSIVLAVGIAKIGAWCYLFSLFIRYHLLGNRLVFVRLPSLFPSTYGPRGGDEPDADDARDAPQSTIRHRDLNDSRRRN